MNVQHFEDRIPIFRALGLAPEYTDQLRTYVEELWQANSQLNLFSRKMSFEELIDNHIIDCLMTLKDFPMDSTVIADFGAGGGLPGVIYAIQFPKKRFRLYEKSRLKQEFLKHCKQIGPNLEVLGEIPEQLGPVDLVVSRAFKSIAGVLEFSRSYYAKGGRYYLMKARLDKINEELNDAKRSYKNLKTEIIPLKSPVLEVERHVVVINP